MKRTIKIVNLVLVLILLCVSVFAFAGCEDKDKKYEVTLKISCRDASDGAINLGELIMTPDIKEIVLELEYRETGYHFSVPEYSFYNHPEYKNLWFDSREVNWISTSYLGTRSFATQTFKEKGKYQLLVVVDNDYSYPVYPRRVMVFVKIV